MLLHSVRTVLAATLFACVVPAVAQITFTRNYNVWCEGAINNFQQTSDAGYVLATDAVYEQDTVTVIGRGYIIKSDAQGVTQWIKQYPKTDISVKPSDGNSIFQTSDGGYIVGTADYAGPFPTTRLIKTDANGNLQWTRLYPGNGVSACYCVKQTTDGGFIFCGYTGPASTFSRVIYVVKTDNAGIPQWGKTFDIPSGISGTANCVNQTADGGYIVAGQCTAGGFVFKLNANGQIAWDQIVSGGFFYCCIQLADGGYAVTGSTTLYNITPAILLKFNAGGALQWSQQYQTGPGEIGMGTCVKENADGSLALVATSYNDSAWLVCLIKTDPSGQPLWMHAYEQSWSMQPCLDNTADGGYAFTATWYKPGDLIPGPCVIKTDENGFVDCNAVPETLRSSSFEPMLVNGFIVNDVMSSVASTILLSAVVLEEDECGPVEYINNPTPGGPGGPVTPIDSGLTTLYIPNIFTPNGDDINDYFVITDNGVGAYHLEIYDRWGVLIFVSDNRNVHWDGNYMRNGEPVSDGTYYYILGSEAAQRRTGFLTLIR